MPGGFAYHASGRRKQQELGPAVPKIKLMKLNPYHPLEVLPSFLPIFDSFV